MRDVRLAVRLLAKHRGYTAVSVLILALAMGGTTAVFSLLHAVLFRPLPYAAPDQLIVLRDSRPPQFPSFAVAPGRFFELQARTRALTAVAAASTANSDVTLTGGGEPERLRGARVSKELFRTLGVAPLLGRTFSAEEDVAKGPDVALISYTLWQSRFGGRPDAVGMAIGLEGRPATIIGILPASFEFPTSETQIWQPLALPPDQRTNYGSHNLLVVGRLQPGMGLERAQQDMQRIARELETVDEVNEGWGLTVRNLHEYLVRDVKTALYVLAGAVGFLLLIGYANIANLLIARGVTRRRELALRAALGATRRDLVRQLMVEHLVLGLLGGLSGLLLAWGLVRTVAATATGMLPAWAELRVDPVTVGFALLISLLSPVVFGLLPALQLSGTDLMRILVQGGRSAATSLGRSTRSALVVAEIALALLLVIGGGLLLRSFSRLVSIDPGFDPKDTVVAAITLPELRYPEPERRVQFYQTLAQEAAALPGVRAVGLSSVLPFRGGWISELLIEGASAADAETAATTDFYAVSPGYFSAMRIPLVRGRGLAVTDIASAPPVAVISQSVADKMFPGVDPLGRRIKVPVRDATNEWREIVGIVGNVKQFGLDRETSLQVYEPAAQHPSFTDMSLVLRSATDPATLTTDLRALLRKLDPGLAIASTTTMEAAVAQSVGSRQLTLVLLSVFALVAILLAAVGIYGLLSFTVGQRQQEIGVRMAHGARPRDILVLVLSQGLALAAIGIVCGLIGALWLTSVMQTLLFSVDAKDPIAFIAAPVILLIVAIAATAVPALRAMRVDPIVALRPDA